MTTHKITNNHHLTIIRINIANLLSKLSSLKVFLANISNPDNRPNIISVVETHISQDGKSGYDDEELSNILPGYKFFYAGRRKKKGGGVGIFVESGLANGTEVGAGLTREVSFVEEIFEAIIIKIPGLIPHNNGCSKNLVVITIYRQPGNNNTDEFLKQTEKWLKLLDKRTNEIVVTGDLNLDLLKYENHLPTAEYLDLMIAHKLLPRISRPSRIKKQSATLIDHIFTRDNDRTILSGILSAEIAGSHGYTDHFPVFSIIKIKPKAKEKTKLIRKCYFTAAGCLKRREGLRGEDWGGVYRESDANRAYDLIQEKYHKHYNNALTIKIVKSNSNKMKREPWMTTDILADMKKKDRLAKLKDRGDEYRSLRNDLVGRV